MIGHKKKDDWGDDRISPGAALTRSAFITAIVAVMLVLLWLVR
ncbi:MAG: hypothetical protein E6614_14525 [Bradyrhizobium sp.]|jgi:hypothetical protein|nr:MULTISPECIES: hypothetical protein [Bradyrhizobium]MDU0956032.1 hypothetical protein [Bradyrhizobium sp.]MDU1493257.1 hypothetical protein [Bradyrhizobium sp.]MDU1543427.1 hypothetical protein [Bradyrhizobium sp.]MDU1664952.1 hypothetical protein [Bradyrhizobium sp.]MDU1691432.1 hypothetical protein [Bradyrhizobium sp.]